MVDVTPGCERTQARATRGSVVPNSLAMTGKNIDDGVVPLAYPARNHRRSPACHRARVIARVLTTEPTACEWRPWYHAEPELRRHRNEFSFLRYVQSVSARFAARRTEPSHGIARAAALEQLSMPVCRRCRGSGLFPSARGRALRRHSMRRMVSRIREPSRRRGRAPRGCWRRLPPSPGSRMSFSGSKCLPKFRYPTSRPTFRPALPAAPRRAYSLKT